MMTEFWADGMHDSMSNTKRSMGSCGTSPRFTPVKSKPAEEEHDNRRRENANGEVPGVEKTGRHAIVCSSNHVRRKSEENSNAGLRCPTWKLANM